MFFLFDLLYLHGEDLRPRPLIEGKERLGALLANAAPCLHCSDHVIGQGPAFYEKACAMHVEGIVSKRIDAPYTPGNRGLWRKVKCLNRAEFVVVGWTDPEGARPFLGALLLAYYAASHAQNRSGVPLSAGRRWLAAGDFPTAVPFTAGPGV